MAKMTRERARALIKWVENTTLPARTIAEYMGVKTSIVQNVIDQVRYSSEDGEEEDEEDEEE